jgi:hypothetical protein
MSDINYKKSEGKTSSKFIQTGSGGARGGQRGLSPLYKSLSPLLKIFEKYSFSMKYKIEHFLLFLFVN